MCSIEDIPVKDDKKAHKEADNIVFIENGDAEEDVFEVCREISCVIPTEPAVIQIESYLGKCAASNTKHSGSTTSPEGCSSENPWRLQSSSSSAASEEQLAKSLSDKEDQKRGEDSDARRLGSLEKEEGKEKGNTQDAASASIILPVTSSSASTTSSDTSADDIQLPTSGGDDDDEAECESPHVSPTLSTKEEDDASWSEVLADNAAREFLSSSVTSSVSSSTSTASSVSLQIRVPLLDWLAKDSCIGPENQLTSYVTSVTTQTDDWRQDNRRPRPIFSSQWQAFRSFSPAGGVLHLPDSDVILEVPSGAVAVENHVDVTAASYTNLQHLRQTLALREDEVIASPLVELSSGDGEYRFHKHVQLFLPHVVPLAARAQCVKVYHVDVGPDGSVRVQSIAGKIDKAHEDDGHETCAESQPSTTAVDGERENDGHDDKNPEDKELGYFCFLPDGRLVVRTRQFCGYICTICQQRRPEPVLHLLATARHTPPRPVPASTKVMQQVSIRLHLWDRRITIRDFQRVSLTTMSIIE
jgi:hypothetical protein